MTEPSRRPLRTHLLAFGAGLVALTGLAIAGAAWVDGQRLADREADRLADRLALAARGEVGRQLDPAAALLQVLALGPGARGWDTLAGWRASLPALAAALDAEDAAVALYVGDDAGRYLTLRQLPTAEDARVFAAPAGTAWVVQARGVADAGGDARYLHLDAGLRERGAVDAPRLRDFDPRTRPWYLAARATDGIASVPPYRFFSTGRPGLSLARGIPGGGVLGVDLRLDLLEPVLAEAARDSGALLALVDGEGHLLAASRGAPEGEPGPALQALLASAADGAARTTLDGAAQRLRRVPLDVDAIPGLGLVVAVPEAHLLGDARRQALRGLGVAALAMLAALALARRTAARIARPLQRLQARAEAIRGFAFAPTPPLRSRIQEVDALAGDLDALRDTLGRFLALLGRVAAEPDFDTLLPLVADEASRALRVRGAVLRLAEPGADGAAGSAACWDGAPAPWLPAALAADARDPRLPDGARVVHAVPLSDRGGAPLGVLELVDAAPLPEAATRFAEALSGFAAVALESRRLIAQHKALFEAFVQLLADAIDAKSPHTGQHCQRVPALVMRLAEAADAATDGPLAGYRLGPERREVLRLAAWLHDCGKVTTPEYVVDKATRLETLHDRIHEVRTRFEVAKRERELAWLRARLDGHPEPGGEAALAADLRALDEDFAFVAACNRGELRMDEASLARLDAIAARTWTRTLDDRLGLSHEALARLAEQPAAALPAREPLLADRPEHRISRPPGQAYGDGNRWGFRMPVPTWLYDRGELHNLRVERGTLSAEERYKINEHIVQTIRMLESLPFPPHLRDVPEVAGGHHERMDGRGYPRAIPAGTLSPEARMMAVADVYEALTASDRPYKHAHAPDAALRILRSMAGDGHLDPDLVALFATLVEAPAAA